MVEDQVDGFAGEVLGEPVQDVLGGPVVQADGHVLGDGGEECAEHGPPGVRAGARLDGHYARHRCQRDVGRRVGQLQFGHGLVRVQRVYADVQWRAVGADLIEKRGHAAAVRGEAYRRARGQGVVRGERGSLAGRCLPYVDRHCTDLGWEEHAAGR